MPVSGINLTDFLPRFFHMPFFSFPSTRDQKQHDRGYLRRFVTPEPEGYHF
jgi:hypothetical protein